MTSWILEFQYKPISISDNWTNILQVTGLDNIVSIWIKGKKLDFFKTILSIFCFIFLVIFYLQVIQKKCISVLYKIASKCLWEWFWKNHREIRKSEAKIGYKFSIFINSVFPPEKSDTKRTKTLKIRSSIKIFFEDFWKYISIRWDLSRVMRKLKSAN